MSKLSRQIGNFARTACILEVTTEKPGNVTPTHDFTDTKFENFVFGSMLIGDAVEKAFINGYQENFRIGKQIYDFVRQSKTNNKTNTHFGIALLFIPLATALGTMIKNKKKFKNFDELKDAIDYVMKKTESNDSIYIHKAIKTANVRVSENADKFDVLSRNFADIVRKENVKFYDLLKISADKDLIAKELTTKMDISFRYLVFLKNFSIFSREISRGEILLLYLNLLSKYPDTLIAKKYGINMARDVSKMAKEVIDKNLAIEKFSDYMYKNNINPGSTADITANVVFLYLLKKFINL